MALHHGHFLVTYYLASSPCGDCTVYCLPTVGDFMVIYPKSWFAVFLGWTPYNPHNFQYFIYSFDQFRLSHNLLKYVLLFKQWIEWDLSLTEIVLNFSFSFMKLLSFIMWYLGVNFIKGIEIHCKFVIKTQLIRTINLEC